MTRECSEDYRDFAHYIQEYSISGNLENPEYCGILKSIHKAYFSAINLRGEVVHREKFFSYNGAEIDPVVVLRVCESVSDIGSAVFNWMNGNYKTARVMIRVLIENYVRAISSLDDKGQLDEKNVYAMLAKAKVSPCFSVDPFVKRCFENLHSDYKLLCRDAHTASEHDMQQLTSLADIPGFDCKKSKETGKVIVRATKNLTTSFCLIFNNFFHTMHHRNKENVLLGVWKDVKPRVLAPDASAATF